MKTFLFRSLVSLLLVTQLACPGGGGPEEVQSPVDTPVDDPVGPTPGDVEARAQVRREIDNLMAALPEREAPGPRTVEVLASLVEKRQDAGGPKACATETRRVTEAFEELPLLETAHESVIPGLALQEKSVQDGTLVPLPLARGPLTFVLSGLPLEDTQVQVAQVTTASAQQALATLQLRAAQQEVPARLGYHFDFVSSFQQASHSLGVALQYSSALAKAGFEAEFEQDASLSTRRVVVRLIQPAYTVLVADDQLASVADFFAEGVTADTLRALIQQGALGPDNLPTFVKAITYGRVLYVLVSTEDAKDNQELSMAFNASFRGFEGNAEAQSAYQRIMSRASVRVLALGGSQEDALSAIRTGDFSLFFKPMKASDAVPLSYKLHYMHGDRGVVALRSALEYTVRDCTQCTEAKQYETQVLYRIPHLDVGGDFTGDSRDYFFGGGCASGWQRHTIVKQESGGGHCEVSWVSNQPNDCRVKVHLGVPAFRSVECDAWIWQKREVPNQPPLCPSASS